MAKSIKNQSNRQNLPSITLIIPSSGQPDNLRHDIEMENLSRFNIMFSQLLSELVSHNILKQDLAGDLEYLVEDYIDRVDSQDDFPESINSFYDDDEDFDF